MVVAAVSVVVNKNVVHAALSLVVVISAIVGAALVALERLEVGK